MVPMNQPTGIDWKHVTFVTSQRADRLPATLPPQVFKRACGNCDAETYTEIEYPADVPLLCNVCCQSPGYTAHLSPAILPKHRREC